MTSETSLSQPLISEFMRAAAEGRAISVLSGSTDRGAGRKNTRSLVAERWEAAFNTSLETMLDPFVILIPVFDVDGTVVDFTYEYANSAACVENRIAREDLIGCRLLELVPAHRSSGLFEMYCHTLDSGEPLVLDRFFYEDKWGGELKVRWLDVRANRVDGALACTWRDVTPELNERQALEDRVLQQATISRLSRFVLGGAAEEQILDEAVRAVAETLHVELAKYLELSPRQDTFVLRAAVGWPQGLVGTATIPAGGHRSYAGYVISEGHPVLVQDMRTETRFTPMPLLIERGVVSGLSVVVYGDHGTLGVLGGHSRTRRDFTEDEADFLQTVANVVSAGVLRRRGEDEVATRTAELANSNKELEAFSYSVSHDLRAPLRAIHGFSKILLEDYAECLDVEGRRVLGIICSNTEKMGQLIDDILAFSRLGRHDLQSSMVDMDGLARSVADELLELEQGREIRIHIEPLPEGFGDPALLRQVWANLLSNALKFTVPKPRADITIECDERADDILYRIRDNGTGFDMKYVDTLFGVFRRLHGHEFPGTGIGLAIVKRVITRHGGTVGAEGRENEGACFTFTLPRPDKEKTHDK